MMAPRAQYRRAIPERIRTGMFHQLRANAPLHQRCSSPTRSRANWNTANVLPTLSDARLRCRKGIGPGLELGVNWQNPSLATLGSAPPGDFAGCMIGVPSKGM